MGSAVTVDPTTAAESEGKEVTLRDDGDHPLENLMPVKIADKLRLAKIFVESGLMPAGLKTPQQVFIALQMGHELGLSPMMAVNNIHVVNGRPGYSADLMVARARHHREFAGYKLGWDAAEGTTCIATMKRRLPDGTIEEFESRFSMEDAKRAKLHEKDNWRGYPKRMLKARASAYVARDAFPDMFAGVYTEDEAEEIQDVAYTIVEASEPQAETERPLAEQPATVENVTRQTLVTKIGACMASGLFNREEAQAYAKLIKETATEGLPELLKTVEGEKKRREDQKANDDAATKGWEQGGLPGVPAGGPRVD